MIRVIKPGMFTTVQDRGRFGVAHLGVSPGGAADTISFRAANRAVGNYPDAAALEITLLGPTVEFLADAVVATSCARFSCAAFEPVTVRAGDLVTVPPLADGARAYLAVRGGIGVPLVLGSASTFVPASLGGHEGRALRAGDVLKIGTRVEAEPRRIDVAQIDSLVRRSEIRVTRGPQADRFDVEQLCRTEFTVSDASNRSGLRLQGDAIRACDNQELVTEGVALGAIQVPPDGQPIILFVDQQTTGGYPKIANVIRADLAAVGQLRPRDRVRFVAVSFSDALRALREQERVLTGALR